jgi:ankyrin repeat protein
MMIMLFLSSFSFFQNGYTALIFASRYGNVGVIGLLLSHVSICYVSDININIKDNVRND